MPVCHSHYFQVPNMPPRENYNSEALGTTTSTEWHQCLCISSFLWRLCRTAYVLVCLCVDARTVMSALCGCGCGQQSWVEVWAWAELQQLELTPMGELGKWPQTSPQRTERESEIGDDPECSMLLVDALWCCSPFLRATLFYVVTKIILCLCDCVCKCVYEALRAGSSGDALTPPTKDITMESPSFWATVPNPPLCPPTHTWKTTIPLSYVCTGQLVGILTNTGSIKAESGHISLCMCVSMCVWGQWRDDGKAKRCTHTHMLLSWHVWG